MTRLATLLLRLCPSLLAALLLASPLTAAPLELAFIYANPQHRENLTQVMQRYTTLTGQAVNLQVLPDALFKQRLPHWLDGERTPDILIWQGGERLLSYARRGLLLPLTDLWQSEDWYGAFGPAMASSVSLNGQPYALPYSYYPWGLFYSQPLFAAAGLPPPTHWQQLLHSCAVLRQRGIIPIMLGTKESWPALAWFDYLDLRLNGLAFHQQLTRGEIPYTDPRVTAIFTHWRALVEAKCFNDNQTELDWKKTLPYLYHGKAAMVLMASFIVPRARLGDIGLLPFPRLRPDMPRYEDAPLDLFVIPARATRQPDQAKQLLRYLGQAEVQRQLRQGLSSFSPYRAADTEAFPTAQAILRQAAGYAQYFDRDVPPAFDQAASPLLSTFPQRPDIAAIQQQLEQLRQRHYPAVSAAATP
ncbi:extracellular solute-binding protein [Pseudaeromonas sp. ZJS20]|uniref:ABC transporter substrate-binding protein n=1 Tax=Pseudaeromonas aegiceratis TaxID=3153928 RepID=UPI00390CC282